MRLVAQTNFGSRDSEISQLCCNSVELVALRELAQVGACSSTMSMHSKRRRGDKAALLSVARKPCRRAPIAPSNVVAPPSWTQIVAHPFESARARQRLALGHERRTHAPAHFAPCAAGAHERLTRHVDVRTARLRRHSKGGNSQRSADGICSCRVFLFVTDCVEKLDVAARHGS